MKYPNVEVQLSGEDGNTFSIIGKTRRALRKANVPDDEVEQFTNEATAGNYEDAIRVVGEWVNVT